VSHDEGNGVLQHERVMGLTEEDDDGRECELTMKGGNGGGAPVARRGQEVKGVRVVLEPCSRRRGGREGGGGVAPTGGRGWAACLSVKQGRARTPTCGPRQQYRVAALNLIRNQFK
jgi:hypothetical protein